MGFIGRIIKHYIEDQTREVISEIYNGYNKSSVLSLPAGIDACPILGDINIPENIYADKTILVEIDSAGHTAIVGVVPDGLVNEGEIKIYGRVITSGQQASYVLCKPDGIIELNGNTDFAVRYLELEKAFNKLKSDYNAHTHNYNPGPGAAAATTATTATTADISLAKVDTVLMPEVPN